MNENKPEQNNRRWRRLRPYTVILTFGIGVIVGYQIPVDWFKTPIVIDLSALAPDKAQIEKQ
ncbi:MAG: hypothetical protein ACU841_11195 [Gammaproteobacteria bacterium]